MNFLTLLEKKSLSLFFAPSLGKKCITPESRAPTFLSEGGSGRSSRDGRVGDPSQVSALCAGEQI